MKANRLIPAVAVLAFAVACTENASNPVANNDRPLFGAGGTPANPAYKSSLFSVASSANFDLTHAWRQTGLGSFTTVAYELTANFTATAHCENKGGNTVNGQPFQISGTASTGPVPQTPRNGSINGSLLLSVSAPPCQPPGGNPHAPIIDSVTWFQITFCWGTATSTTADLQGPTPGGKGFDVQLSGGQSASGTPLTGDAAAGLGIFEADCTF
jgi:hypothetical protein